MSEFEYETKDSGERVEFASGMRRDVQTGKPRYDLVWKPGLKRVAELMARGAEKYGDNNWQLANSVEELQRFRASANRHFEQWIAGDRDEDHMAATVFNLFAAEYVEERLAEVLAGKPRTLAEAFAEELAAREAVSGVHPTQRGPAPRKVVGYICCGDYFELQPEDTHNARCPSDGEREPDCWFSFDPCERCEPVYDHQ